MYHVRTMRVMTFLLAMLFFSACASNSAPPIKLKSDQGALWGQLETVSISQSQVLGEHLLLSTDLGLLQLSFSTTQPQAKFMIPSKEMILLHGIYPSQEASKLQYFYVKNSRLRFFQISLPTDSLLPKHTTQDTISTKKYGALLDGITPGRHVFAKDASSLYLARYAQLAQFKVGEKAKDTFHMPNFASYLVTDQNYLYYRSYEREKTSSHVMACVDMQESKEVWRKYYGPDHQAWYDIADSFPVISKEDQLYHIIRAYPLENYEKEGLFLVEHIDKSNGEVLNSFQFATSKAIASEIPTGPMIIQEELLLGEIDLPKSLSLLDMNANKILWTQQFDAPVLDMLYDSLQKRWVLLMGDASIIALDKLSGDKLIELPPLDFSAQSFSYGQLHITEKGDFVGHLNNQEAYTVPRAVFFYRPAP